MSEQQHCADDCPCRHHEKRLAAAWVEARLIREDDRFKGDNLIQQLRTLEAQPQVQTAFPQEARDLFQRLQDGLAHQEEVLQMLVARLGVKEGDAPIVIPHLTLDLRTMETWTRMFFGNLSTGFQRLHMRLERLEKLHGGTENPHG